MLRAALGDGDARGVLVHPDRVRTGRGATRRPPGDAPLAARHDRPRRARSWPTRSPSTRPWASAPTATPTDRRTGSSPASMALHVTAGLAAMGLLYVRSVRSRSPAALADLDDRRLAVLAPRRRDLGVRVRHDLGDAVKVALGDPGGGGRGRRPRLVQRLGRAAGPAPATMSARRCTPTGCASCHGVDGEGVEDRGPTLRTEGRAAVNFVLRTGRMPLADSRHPARPRPGALHRGRDRRPRRLRRRVR